MRIFFYLLMGSINLLFFLTSLKNKDFWNSMFGGRVFHLGGFLETLGPLLMYIASISFAYYCFSIKARKNKMFWQLNFVANFVLFILNSSLLFFAKYSSIRAGGGGDSVVFALATVSAITTLNLVLLLYRVQVNLIDKND